MRGLYTAPLAARSAALAASRWRGARFPGHHRDVYYRVDYTVALVVIGAIAAVAGMRRAAAIDPRSLARRYLAATVAVVALRVVLVAATWCFGPGVVPAPAAGLAGDLGLVLVGAVHGVALRAWLSGARAELLRAPQSATALRVSTGVGFAVIAVGSAVHHAFMVEFFTQSGYSTGFLHAVMAGELLGGLALLLGRPSVTIAVTAALAIDMVGAIATHAHNGDPLDDSAAAIGMLLRLAAIAALYVPRARLAVGAAMIAARSGTLCPCARATSSHSSAARSLACCRRPSCTSGAGSAIARSGSRTRSRCRAWGGCCTRRSRPRSRHGACDSDSTGRRASRRSRPASPVLPPSWSCSRWSAA
jgi:hypothetical protein